MELPTKYGKRTSKTLASTVLTICMLAPSPFVRRSAMNLLRTFNSAPRLGVCACGLRAGWRLRRNLLLWRILL
jgi:hypothetical protein